MPSTFTMVVNHTTSLRTFSSDLRREWNQDANDVIRKIYSGESTSGASLVVADGQTTASGAVTISGAVANGDTVTVGGTVFTAAASPTGNQFLSGAVVATSAASLAAAINASATAAFRGMVTAASTAGVVTVTAAAGGPIGNLVSLAKSGTNIAVSGAVLTGGTSNAAVANLY